MVLLGTSFYERIRWMCASRISVWMCRYRWVPLLTCRLKHPKRRWACRLHRGGGPHVPGDSLPAVHVCLQGPDGPGACHSGRKRHAVV